MASLGDINTAVGLRDAITTIATTVVNEQRPAERIGKVYSIDLQRSVAKIYFPGEDLDSLIEARFAKDKIPTEVMATTFQTYGYDATANIVRISGTPGSYFILDYVSGIPAVDPSARALVVTNTTTINQNVAAIAADMSSFTADMAENTAALAELDSDLTVLTTTTIPTMQTALGTAQTDVAALKNVTIPALNTRLTTAETDINNAEAAVSTLQGKFPVVGTDISDGAISTPKMTANTINGDRILANTLNASKIVAGSITTASMTANTIDGSVITANTLNATKIVAGTIATDRMTADSINGDRIAANTLSATKIVAGSISTDRMTANTINGDRITINTLTGDKITANTINGDRIVANTIHGDRIIAGTLTANKLNVIAGGENLFTNSSFENTTNAFAGWAKYDNSGVAALGTATGRRGGVAARLQWTTTGQIVGLYQSPPGGFKGGTVYTLSFYAIASSSFTVGATMNVAANAPALTLTTISNPPLTTSWQRYIFNYVRASDTTDSVFLGVAASFGTNGTNKIVDFDDMMIEEGDLATAYSPKSSEVLPGTINAAALTATAIDGKTITGSLFRTAASGKRMELFSDTGDPSKIYFYSGAGDEYTPAQINSGHTPYPGQPAYTSGAIQMLSGTSPYSPLSPSTVAVAPNKIDIYTSNSGSVMIGAGEQYVLLGISEYPRAYMHSGADLWLGAGARAYEFRSGNGTFAFNGMTMDAASDGSNHRMYNGVINRAMWIYGSGFYSSEGTLTVGCEIYGNHVAWSDARDKKNPKRTESALEVARQLPVYDYDTPHGGANKGPNKEHVLVRRRGIMAQDLQKVAPHLVHDETDDPDTGFGMGVDLYGVIATTLAALQELDEEVKQLKEKNK